MGGGKVDLFNPCILPNFYNFQKIPDRLTSKNFRQSMPVDFLNLNQINPLYQPL